MAIFLFKVVKKIGEMFGNFTIKCQYDKYHHFCEKRHFH